MGHEEVGSYQADRKAECQDVHCWKWTPGKSHFYEDLRVLIQGLGYRSFEISLACFFLIPVLLLVKIKNHATRSSNVDAST